MTPELPVIPNRSRGRKTTRKHSLRIDMTPMVDLRFLLIAFFVMTTELSKPRALDLAMPKDGPPIDLAKSDALNVMLGAGNRIHFYHGNWADAVAAGNVSETNFSPSGLRKIIREKQLVLDQSGRKEGRAGLMLIIKPGSGSSYKNLVEVLDEVIITDVKKYTIVKPGIKEEMFLQ